MIEAIDPQSVEANQTGVSSMQPQVVVQQINAAGQTASQISGTQQPLILQQVDQGSADSDLCKDVSSEDKPQSTLPVDLNKSQTINQQSQYLIQPIQANVVHVDSSKQQHNSVQTHYISYKNVNSALQVGDAQKINLKDFQALPIGKVEGNKVKYQTFIPIGAVNNQHQFLMQQVYPVNQKTIGEIGKEDKRLITQQTDGREHPGFIIQHLNSNNSLQSQILMNSLKGNKSQQTVIQNVEFSEKGPQTVTVQNIENTQFVMKKTEGIKQQLTQYQTQHFIVPQGEKLQPKLVVHRLEMPKPLASASQLIVQQFQPATSTQGSQYVVQQLDLSNHQNLLPYIVSSPTPKHSIPGEIVQKVDSGKKEGKAPQCVERKVILKEKVK